MAGATLTTYQELLRIELRHDYFLDGQLPDLAITATRATAERLRRAGIVLRQQPSGCALLWADTRPVAPAVQEALGKQVFPLLFALQPRTAAFQLYTALPTGQADQPQTYFFGSPPLASAAAPAAATGSGAAGLLLVPPPTLLSLRPLAFAYPRPAQPALPAAPEAGTANLSAQGEQLAEWPPLRAEPWLPVALRLSPTAAAVDVSRWGSGCYQLRVGTPAATDGLVFFADDELYAARAWGVLAIGPEALAAPLPPMYRLSFATRAVYWQYQVQLITDNQLTPTPPALEIREAKTPTNSPADFEEWASLPPGVSRSFRSKEKIMLKDNYSNIQHNIFTLHSTPQEPTRLVRKPLSILPHAELQHLKTEQEGAVAEIFVRIRL